MMKLPIHKSDFESIRKRDFIYVDKTDILVRMIEEGEAYFLSRPKGFGKTLLISTLAAIFQGKSELFKGLSAEKWLRNQEKIQYPVLNFDLSILNTNSIEQLEESFEDFLITIAEDYEITISRNGNLLATLLNKVYKKLGDIVILIDNYDTAITNARNNKEILRKINSILRLFYQTIEANNKYIKFILITGKEKYTTTGVYATLQGLHDITNDQEYLSVVGFTLEEIEKNFTDWVKENIAKDPNSFFSKFRENKDTLFSPSAIITSLREKNPENYFSHTKTNTALLYKCINNGDTYFLEVKKFTIYVDKSELLIHTNRFIETEHKYICMSRPRRFGKTISANMIAAYYDIAGNAHSTFSELKICKHTSFSTFANKYIVIKITVQDYLSKTHDIDLLIENIKNDIIDDLQLQYGYELNANDFTFLMQDVTATTGKKFVIVLDEWDCILREYKDKIAWQEKYLDFLRFWFKDRPYIALVYMTGILPIKKYGTHSALNMFDEYSMLAAEPFTEFLGFTESEVRELCKKYKRNFAECKRWYDGYQVDTYTSIYNPRSVNQCISTGAFRNYWNTTETYEALRTYISLKNFGLQDIITTLLANGSVSVETSTFANDMRTFRSKDDVLTLLVHLGYLSYSETTKTVRIPNKEITAEFVTAIRDGGWPIVVAAIDASANLLSAALRGDAAYVAKGVEAAHLETSHLQYNDENALAYTISLAFFAAREKYTIVREFPTGKGFADLVFLPRPFCTDPALLIELKWDKSAATAISQIHERTYPDSLKNHFGSIVLIGITYDRKSKIHTCSLEFWQK